MLLRKLKKLPNWYIKTKFMRFPLQSEISNSNTQQLK